MNESPHCLKCKYYFATYDPKVPHGCRIYGFKSTTMPSSLVKKETNQECQACQIRSRFKSDDPLDLTRKDYW